MIEVSGKMSLGWREPEKFFVTDVPAQTDWPHERIQAAFNKVWFEYVDVGRQVVSFIEATYKNGAGEKVELDTPVK
jgi:hypothetical protein